MRTLIRTNLVINPNLEVGIATMGGAGLTISQSSEWASSGSYSIKQVSTGVSSDCFSSIDGDTGGFRTGLQAGKTYTLSGTVYTPFAQSGVLRSYARSIALFYKDFNGVYQAVNSPAGPPVGEARVSFTFTVPANATEAFVRLYNGSPTAGDTTYWDSIVVEEGTTDGSFFDGSTLESFYRFQKWTGTPNLSTSEQYRIEVMENFNPQLALQDAKMKSLESILGPSPVKTQNGSLTENQYAAMEKVLRDNALIV